MSVAAWARRFPQEVPERAAAVAMLSTGLGDLVTVSDIVGVANRLAVVKRPVGGRLLGLATPVPKRAGKAALTRAVRYIALNPDATAEQVAIARTCSAPARSGPRRAGSSWRGWICTMPPLR